MKLLPPEAPIERKRSQVGRHLMKNGGRLVTNPKGDSLRGELNLFFHQIGIHAQAIVQSRYQIQNL